MNKRLLEVQGVKYAVKFGFAANRILANKWKCKTLGEIGAKITKRLNFKEGTEPTFDQLAYLGDLIHAGILSQTPNAEITAGDVMDAIMEHPAELTELLKLYIDSMPKPEAAKKPNPGK